MKRFLFILLAFCIVLTTSVCRAEENELKDSLGLPLSRNNLSEQILRRTGYTVSYNGELRIPNWVAWHLTAEHVKGTVPRPSGNAWHEDTDVPTPRCTSEDFRNSGWSRGHMCPAGDCKWDKQVMYESFLFTNCCPQHANLNSGVWNQIEMSCRRWAEKYGDVYIICGPVLFNQWHETIGPNRVVVPEAFFKVIICFIDGKPEGIGYICKNQKEDDKKSSYVNTIKEVERITGFTFFPSLPAELAEYAKNEISPLLNYPIH